MKPIRALLLAATLLLPVSAAMADDMSTPFDMSTLASELKLTQAQQRQIETIRQAEHDQIAAIDTSGVEPGVIRDMIKSGKWDEARARKRIQAFGDVDNQVSYIRVKSLFDISQVLTADQRKQFQQLFAKELSAD
ncbi:Spy/CpxP family protein refolding chaperone [Jeongeupia chitinilytica]|uniref:Periplasmic heavy metal sensor n=1 Tax=Jeongeupia chitinilytica TaxID=1041641 RepID=A0ABQ3GW07_9NEIS|nr:Spy/CpxP family protein refolding chaperone [Jeongeupia chitinilytica]GHD55339.1 hypothetical protein GCM10007350_00860 [Jeongeupia chitinilytica]